VVNARETLGLADLGSVVVRGHESALDALVVGLVNQGIAIRELAPTIPPLEAAFLALTGADTSDYFPEDDPADPADAAGSPSTKTLEGAAR
jgi:ABC-2 type transport system ATP-binding protein